MLLRLVSIVAFRRGARIVHGLLFQCHIGSNSLVVAQ